jgi:predicted ribosome quality control (RQC) complex YloA/Tae2 family protein
VTEADLDYTLSAQKNAEKYFEESKEAKRKIEGAEQAIARLEKKVKELEEKKLISKELTKREEREWYEKFYWFFTSEGTLAIGGRSAQQNELINAKYFDEGDIFFHANVFGASFVVLKDGSSASEKIKAEAAQFAACFSKAWDEGQSSVDVFSAKRDQVSKSQASGYLATGSFLIKGEREWYRNVKLELRAFISETKKKSENAAEVKINKFNIAPELTCTNSRIADGSRMVSGKMKKSDAAKMLSKKLGYADIDYIMQHLPSGSFSLS